LQKFTKIRKKAKKRFDKKTKKNKLHLSNGTETPTGKTNTPQDTKIFYIFILKLYGNNSIGILRKISHPKRNDKY